MALSYPWQTRRNPLVIPTGSKRNQISIQAQSTTQDDTGGEVQVWKTVLTVLAEMATVSSREMYQPPGFTAQVTHLVSIDYPGNSIPVAGGMRVLFGTRTFVIQTVENVQERNRVLKLLCLEINGVL